MTENDPELRETRADERLDLTRLEPYLRSHLPDAVGGISVLQFGGGHANLTYMITIGAREWVLRRPPLGPVAPGAHDMKREHRVLSRLHEAFPLAPRSYLLCDDPRILGAEFQIMERRRGIAIREKVPPQYDDLPELRQRIGDMLTAKLVEFHRVDPAAVGLDSLGKPEGFLQRQLGGWAKRWQAAKDRDLATVDRLVARLQADLPASQAASLVHNDYKLDNMLLDPDDPAVPTALLDWDMCTRGDPLSDLGLLLNYWAEPGDDPACHSVSAMPTWTGGFPSREDAVERYAQLSGLDLSGWRWYHAFGIFKMVVVIQQIYIRYLRGQTADPRFAGFGEKVAAMSEHGLAVAQR
ncbi:phosphotransferase family protein [Denitrobaculum tricleocarpae]|uniref:Phosphotransferase family protein n=1 Tax=Denitrobaculum tricleocarpae TaxID=2591009 RepID=A0A545U2X8_9PROT|nr:phosphotransferase family protein [Denitrobaculum tricleocarpae]TQV83784.1 phosphotransferase family protein [Denitrobaculum tricleocarpae]